jgi:hypothetical protein
MVEQLVQWALNSVLEHGSSIIESRRVFLSCFPSANLTKDFFEEISNFNEFDRSDKIA